MRRIASEGGYNRRVASDKRELPDLEVPDFVVEWLGHAPPGRALDVGAGSGQVAAYLARAGFDVEAVDPNEVALPELRRRGKAEGFRVREVSIADWVPAPNQYALVVAAAVLHFVEPEQIAAVCWKLSRALVPGGLLLAEVLTRDDPSYQARLAGDEPPLAPATFALRPGSSIHYFGPNELRELFSELEILDYEESRRAVPSLAGFRAGATLIGRRSPDVQWAA
jgi:SAM-dependent methyltransferase